MTFIDPVNNDRDVFKSRLEGLSDWTEEISIKDLIIALAKGQDVQDYIDKATLYENYINQKLDEWDAAADEEGRKTIVDSVIKQNFKI